MKMIYRLCMFIILVLIWACEKEQPAKELPEIVEEELAIRLMPSASFIVDSKTVNLGHPICFKSESANNPNSWSWEFGDGNVSNEQNPKHFYKLGGEHIVKLTVENSYGKYTYTKKLVINLIDDPTIGFVRDRSDNEYFTKRIGTQTWMLENLKTIKYRNGLLIQNLDENEDWKSGDKGYSWYENNEWNSKLGAIYNKEAVNTNKIAPSGWHVPSVEDWEILIEYLGGKSATAEYFSNLHFPISTASRNMYGEFKKVDNFGQFWTSTTSSWKESWSICISPNFNDVEVASMPDRYGFAIRCIKN